MRTLLHLCMALAPLVCASAEPITVGAPKLEHANVFAGEGPSWDPRGFLYFTGGNRVSRRTAAGVVETFRNPSGGANGALVDREGRLLICEAAARRVTRTERDGAITILADSYEGKKFNSPNDLTIDSKGRVYFTDPRYGNRAGMEQPFEGVYRIDAPGIVVRVIGPEVERPNGILVSPDDRYLYVADNNNNKVGGARKLWRFHLKPDASVDPASRKLIFDWRDARGPDGLKMDQAGRLFVAAGLNKPNPPFETADERKAGIYILSPEGEQLEFVPIPRDEVTNCAFGGDDLQTLFITAGGSLYSVRVGTPGRISAALVAASEREPADASLDSAHVDTPGPSSSLPSASERTPAEWVIRRGGRVFVNDERRPISTVAELPPGDFRITGVDLIGTTILPRELEKLSSLVHVRELYLPGASWTPGAGNKLDANDALRFLSGMTRLERLQFSLHFLPYFNVTDVAFGHIDNLTQLRELRCAQCQIKKRGLAPFVNLRSLDLSYSTFNDEAMASLADMRQLRRLYLRDTAITDAGLRHIAELTHLEELDLSGVRITDDGMASLRKLKELRKLNLLGAKITDEGLRVLAEMPHLAELNVYRTAITNAGLAVLSGLKELKAVDLRYSRVTASGVAALRAALPASSIEFTGAAAVAAGKTLASPTGSETAIVTWLESLGGTVQTERGVAKRVSLAAKPVGDSQMEFIAKLAGLEQLDISATETGDLGLQHLAKLENLRELNLSGTTVSDAGVARLAGLKSLKVLRLANTAIKGATLGSLTSLVELHLTTSPITNDGLAEIAKIAGLERLSLSGSDISNAGMPHLAQLVALKAVNLNSTDVSDDGLLHLAPLTNLRELSIRHGRFTPKGLEHLRPLIAIERLDLSHARVGSDGVAVIAGMRKLQALNLDYTGLSSKAITQLAGLTELRELSLDSADVNDDIVEMLTALPKLQSVNLYHTLVTEQGVARIKAAHPNCRIVWDRDSALPTRRKT